MIVQGFGQVGYWTSKYMHTEGGAKILGIVEKGSSIYNESGLDPDHVKSFFAENGTLKGYPNA